MNDHEYIREAIGLADGWRVCPDRGKIKGISPPVKGELFVAPDCEWALDALAAQLVRQLDAKGERISFDHSVDLNGSYVGAPFSVSVGGYEGMMMAAGDSKASGDDRTVTTIRAIVESGLLSPQDGSHE